MILRTLLQEPEFLFVFLKELMAQNAIQQPGEQGNLCAGNSEERFQLPPQPVLSPQCLLFPSPGCFPCSGSAALSPVRNLTAGSWFGQGFAAGCLFCSLRSLNCGTGAGKEKGREKDFSCQLKLLMENPNGFCWVAQHRSEVLHLKAE